MDTLSLSKASRLFWLGRYTERVYIGIETAREIFDANVDGREADFADYCRRLGIPSGYKDTADFCRRYYFDTGNPNSIASSLVYAYDNAIVLRSVLTTGTLSYILMALSAMDKAAESDSPAVPLQWVQDDIMAFRGSCEENIYDEETRSIIKLGVSLERVDLCLRLGADPGRVRREFARLANRLYKTGLTPDRARLDFLMDALMEAAAPAASIWELVSALEGLFPEL